MSLYLQELYGVFAATPYSSKYFWAASPQEVEKKTEVEWRDWTPSDTLVNSKDGLHFLKLVFSPYPKTYIPQCFLWTYAEGKLLDVANLYYTKVKQHHAAYGLGDEIIYIHLKWMVAAKLWEALRVELITAGGMERDGIRDKQPDLYDAIVEAQERDKGYRTVLTDWSGDRDAFNTAMLYPVLYPDLLWQEIVK